MRLPRVGHLLPVPHRAGHDECGGRGEDQPMGQVGGHGVGKSDSRRVFVHGHGNLRGRHWKRVTRTGPADASGAGS